MLENGRKGYAVMSADLEGISFESESYNDCLRWLHPDYVIAERLPKKCGFTLSVNWWHFYKPIYIHKYSSDKNILWLHWRVSKNYRHVTGKVITTYEEQQKIKVKEKDEDK